MGQNRDPIFHENADLSSWVPQLVGMMTLEVPMSLWFTTWLLGCGEPRTGVQIGNPGEVEDPCGDAVESVQGLNATLWEDLTARDLLDWLTGTRRSTDVSWFDARNVPIQLEGSTSITEVRVGRVSGPDDCEDRSWVRIDNIDYRLTSDDGAVEQSWTQQIRLSRRTTDLADLGAQAPSATASGTLDLRALHDGGQVERVTYVRLRPDAWLGYVELREPNAPSEETVEVVHWGYDRDPPGGPVDSGMP